MLFPKDRPIFPVLRTSFTKFDVLVDELANEGVTGCLAGTFAGGEGAILFLDGSPAASLFTEVMKFASRKPEMLPAEVKAHLYSEQIESAAPEAEPDDRSLVARVTELLSGLTRARTTDAARFAQFEQAMP